MNEVRMRPWSVHVREPHTRSLIEMRVLAPDVVMHGACATGADDIADGCAEMLGAGGGKTSTILRFTADWQRDGRAAGPLRNAKMLREGEPSRGLAFGALWKRDARMNDPEAPASGLRSGGWKRTGTGDMVKRMLAAGLPVRWIEAPGATAVDLAEMPRPT